MDNGGNGAVESDINIRQEQISDAARRQAIELWNEHERLLEIARATNLTVKQVSAILKLWQKSVIEKRAGKQ